MSDPVQVHRLLVRVPNWVGDVVHSLPAITALRTHFADAELTVVSRGEAGTLLQHHPAVDHVVGYRTVRGFGQLRHLREAAGRLRRNSYELGILLPNSFESAWLFWWAGIPRRYGFATDGRGWLLTEPQSCTAETRRLHQADYYLALLAGLGVRTPRGWQRLEPTAAEREAAGRRLAEAGWRPERPLIALCPGAGFGSAKRWPLDRFGALAVRLAKERGATLVMLGGTAERPMGEALASRVGEGSINLAGETSLRDALAIVSLSTVVVSNDSGLLHLAAASGTPVVALFGPTDPDRTGPTGVTASSVTIVRRPVSCSPCELRECPIDHRCMVWVDSDEVYAAVCRVLAEGPDRGAEASPTETRSCSGSSFPHGPPHTDRGVGASEDVRPTPHGPPHTMIRPAPVVFLDRDGTLNRDIGYLCDPDQLELLPGVGAALRTLHEAGARTVIVTNQSGIARGALTEARLHLVHQRLRHVLRAEGASIDGIFYCPHHPDDRCRCRKPETELIDRARKELALELDRSYVVGDKLADVRLAHRIGATSILVRTGYGERVLKSWPEGERPPDHVANDLPGAVRWLLGQWQSGSIIPSWAGATGVAMGNGQGSNP
jgi:heptosyltransferase-2